MSRATVRATIAILAAALAVGAAAAWGQSAPAGPTVARSSQGVAGRTVIAWSAPFAQFQAERARRSDCSRGQRSLVLFIPAAQGPDQRTSCTAELNQSVMISPAGIICTVPDRGFCTDTARINDVRRVHLSIDGVPVKVRQFDWVSRQAFRVDGTEASVAGYMYIISGLPAGEHTIVAAATFRNPTQRFRMTATVTVR